MISKLKEKRLAIRLRLQGKTYGEILKRIPVAKSTLSLWLRDVGLAKAQKQILTDKRRAAQQKGADARRKKRVSESQSIYEKAMREIAVLSKRERWVIGVSLYWAEGSKEKENRPGQGIVFGNTDAYMMRFFIRWLKEFFSINSDSLSFSLYIHENHKYRLHEVEAYWKNILDISRFDISYIYLKKHIPRTSRQNIGNTYYGTLRVRVKKSTNLQRRIRGSIYGITGEPCPVV